RLLLRHLRERLLGRRGDGDGMPLAAQRPLQRPADGLFVLDNQHVPAGRFHARSRSVIGRISVRFAQCVHDILPRATWRTQRITPPAARPRTPPPPRPPPTRPPRRAPRPRASPRPAPAPRPPACS